MLYCSIAPIQYWLHCKRNSGTAAVPYNQPNVNVFIFFWCCFRFIFISVLVLLCCHTSNKLFGMIWLNFGCWFHPKRKDRERIKKCTNGHMFKHFVLNFFISSHSQIFFFSLDEFLCLFFFWLQSVKYSLSFAGIGTVRSIQAQCVCFCAAQCIAINVNISNYGMQCALDTMVKCDIRQIFRHHSWHSLRTSMLATINFKLCKCVALQREYLCDRSFHFNEFWARKFEQQIVSSVMNYLCDRKHQVKQVASIKCLHSNSMVSNDWMRTQIIYAFE